MGRYPLAFILLTLVVTGACCSGLAMLVFCHHPCNLCCIISIQGLHSRQAHSGETYCRPFQGGDGEDRVDGEVFPKASPIWRQKWKWEAGSHDPDPCLHHSPSKQCARAFGHASDIAPPPSTIFSTKTFPLKISNFVNCLCQGDGDAV